MSPGNFGTINAVDELLGEYHAQMPPDLLHNETDSLLAAVLMELQAQRAAGGDTEEVSVILEQRRKQLAGSDGQQRGTYYSAALEVDDQDWEEVDLGFTASEFDLRNLSGAVLVAFAEPSGNDDKQIEYGQSEAPLAGIPVTTEKFWAKAVSGTETLDMEAWA